MIRLFVPVCSLAFALFAGTMCCASAARINVRDYGAKGDGIADDAPAIQKAIEAARGKGPGTVVTIPAGRYRLNPITPASKCHMEFSHASGIRLEGETATIIIATDPTKAMICVVDSSDIGISVLKMDRHPFVFTQGMVESADPDGKAVVVVVDEGYDDPDSQYIARQDFMMIFSDPDTGTWDHDAPWPPLIEKREKLAPRRFRLALSRAPKAVYVGKPFVIWKNVYRGAGFSLNRSRNVQIEDVDYYGCGANAGFFINRCEGDIVFRRFRVMVPPNSRRRFSASGGSMVFNNRIKLLVEQCEFTNTDDDGFNMGTNSSHIFSQQSPRMVTIEKTGAEYRPGDNVALWDWADKKMRTEAKVVGSVCDEPTRSCRVTLDRDVTVLKTGPASATRKANEYDGIDRLVNPDDVGSVIIRNSIFHSLRARNILIKASNSIIENNEFRHTAMAAILVGPEFYWDEGPSVHDLIIRNNRFINVSGSNIFVGTHKSEQSLDNRRITIEGNTFLRYGHYAFGTAGKQGTAVYVRNTDGVTVRNNRMESPDTASPKISPILIEASKHAIVSANTLPEERK